MAKSKTPLIEDPDLLAPKLSRDEIQNDEPTKSQLKKAIVNVDTIPMPPLPLLCGYPDAPTAPAPPPPPPDEAVPPDDAPVPPAYP